MPDQTPELLTDDQLREIVETPDSELLLDEMVGAMAAELLAARTRIAELEAQSAADRNVARKLIDARARDIVAEEKAQAEPDAYIAVKRTYSPNADRPEWDWHAIVIPAGDEFAEDRDWRAERGFDLLPIVGTETGTRPAAPQSDPAGYVVVTRNPEGGLHRSATVWDDLERATAAGDFQARHAEGTGCSAAVHELGREVNGDA